MMQENSLPLLHIKHNTMKRTKKEKEKEVNEIVPLEKKSKIALFWEQNPSEGKIINMRAVLK